MEMEGVPTDRLYYVLRPENGTGGTIFTPVENSKVALRRIMTKEEVEELLGDMSRMETLDISNEKLRETCYKECMKSCDSRNLVRMIKTISLLLGIPKGKVVDYISEKIENSEKIYKLNFFEIKIPASENRN